MRERLKRGMGEMEVGEGEKNRRVDVDCIVEEEAGVEMNCSEEGCYLERGEKNFCLKFVSPPFLLYVD